MALDIIGLQFDLARQKENLEYVKNYFSFAKENGYNCVFLYLEGMVRTSVTNFFDKEKTYSLDEIREIVSYAEEIGIEIIPMFENLGHTEHFLERDEYKDLAEFQDVKKEGRGFSVYKRGTNACISNPRLYKILDTYIEEVSGLFKSKYVHVGLDEIFEIGECERCKKRLENGETKEDMFYKHIMHTYGLVKKLGKTMMMWDDMFEYLDIVDSIPNDIILFNWQYGYIKDDLKGHWINRPKQDWFRKYDALGIKYVFCVWGRVSLETFTEYAKNYNPFGSLMTNWENIETAGISEYPKIAYAGRLWNGKTFTREEKEKFYNSFYGNIELTKLILSSISISGSGYKNIPNIAENDTELKFAERERVKFLIDKLKDNLENDYLKDLYVKTLSSYLNLSLGLIANNIIDKRERGQLDFDEIIKVLKEVEYGYCEIGLLINELWQKYRQGIKQPLTVENYFIDKKIYIENLINQLQNIKPCGVLYFDCMLHDIYCTVKASITIRYKDELQENEIYNAQIKPAREGCYMLRFCIEPKVIEYITLSVFGEGALYPTNMRYLLNDKLYIASEVEKLEGLVNEEENLLTSDTQFVTMGNNDGQAHLRDLSMSRQKHTVKVKFKQYIS